MTVGVITLLGTIASGFGLAVTIFVLRKVGSLERGKQNERDFMRGVLGFDTINDVLADLGHIIRRNRKQIGEQAASDALDRISGVRARISTALETISEIYDEGVYHCPVMYTGYYSKGFLASVIPQARRLLRIACYRNMRIGVHDILELIADRLRERCRVELVFLSPDAPQPILAAMAEKLPYPNMTVDELRREIREKTAFMARFLQGALTKTQLRRLHCRTCQRPLRFHMVQTDDRIYFALPNYKSELVQYGGKPLRPTVIVKTNSPIGRFVTANFDYMFRELSEPVAIGG